MPLVVIKLIHLRSCETCVPYLKCLLSIYIRLCDVCLSNMKCLCMCSVTWCLSCLLFVMHYLLHFHVFILLHLSSHLDMLDAPCEGYDIGAKPEDGIWCTYPKDGRTKQVLQPEMSPRVQADWTDLCRIPSKPQSIISLLISKINWVYMLSILMH
jgi:hypothetical protein